MAINTVYNTQGATPGVIKPYTTGGTPIKSYPAKPGILGNIGNALNTAKTAVGNYLTDTSNVRAGSPLANLGTTLGGTSTYKGLLGPYAPPTGTEGVKTPEQVAAETKKTTSEVTPPSTTPMITQDEYRKSIGLPPLNSSTTTPPPTPPVTTPPPITTTPATTPTTTTSSGYTPEQPPTLASTAADLANLLKNPDPEIKQAAQDIQNLKNEYAQKGVNIDQTAGFLTQAGGEKALLQNQYLTALDALQGKLGNLLTARGQGITATTAAMGAVSPVGQFGMLTNPITGAPLNTQVFQSAIKQAQDLVNAGTPANDPSVQALLSPFGFVGPLAFNQAMQAQSGGTFNPAAQSAGASQTIAQGTQAQGAAFTLDTGIKQLATLPPIINSVMQSSGINSTDSPLYNQQIGTYLSQLGNPGAWAQFQYTMGELRKFQSQLLAAGAGGIPTDVSNTINTTDISKLSMKDIRTAMETLDILGKNQQSVLQAQQAATGVTGYSGAPQNIQTNVPAATPSTSPGAGVTTPGGQFAAGTGLSVAQSMVSDLGKMIMSFIAGEKLAK